MQEKDGAEFVIIKGTTGNNASIESINFISGLAHRNTRAESDFECLSKEHDLVVNAEIFMVLAKGIEDGRGSLKVRDSLVVCM